MNPRIEAPVEGTVLSRQPLLHSISATTDAAPDPMSPVPGLTTGGYIVIGGFMLGIDF